jgi:hypothetical protein
MDIIIDEGNEEVFSHYNGDVLKPIRDNSMVCIERDDDLIVIPFEEIVSICEEPIDAAAGILDPEYIEVQTKTMGKIYIRTFEFVGDFRQWCIDNGHAIMYKSTKTDND